MNENSLILPEDHLKADLSPHPAQEVEWWFCQGSFEGPETPLQDFVLVLLRRGTEASEHGAGWLALLSVTDAGNGARQVVSRVCSNGARGVVATAAEVLARAGLAAELAEAYVDELSDYGPPEPIEVCPPPEQIGEGGLQLVWQDIRLIQGQDQRIQLHFTLPASGEQVVLELQPEAAWFQGERVGLDEQFGRMDYSCCPRLQLTGQVGETPVAGRAWLDHQWGGEGWFTPDEATGEVLGWCWLAVNLDDGRDLILSVSRSMASRQPVWAGAVLFEPGKKPRSLGGISVQEDGWWQSPDSFARYPTGLRFVCSELGAEISFTPGLAHCEIPICGLATAVWEGAGQVRGHIGGHKVAGRGHLELFGYAFPSGFDRTLEEWIARVDRRIEGFLARKADDAWLRARLGPARWEFDAEAHTELLCKPAWDLLLRGGKHWRSVFNILLLRALGQEVEPYEEMITVIPELVHAGSLIIDDIEDASVLRRGKPAIHRLYGEAAAINAGNTLYFLPMLTVTRHAHLDLAQREAILSSSYDLFVRAHFGQAQDIYSEKWRGRDDVFEKPGLYARRILQTYAFKTAAPIVTLTNVLCIVARADARVTRTCLRYAEDAGVAFQILDDVNNFAGGAGWGKEIGEDLRAGKITYVILRALELLEHAERQRLKELLRQFDGGEEGPAHREALALIRKSQALELCYDEALAMINDGWEELSAVVAPSQAKTLLRLMFARLFRKQ